MTLDSHIVILKKVLKTLSEATFTFWFICYPEWRLNALHLNIFKRHQYNWRCIGNKSYDFSYCCLVNKLCMAMDTAACTGLMTGIPIADSSLARWEAIPAQPRMMVSA